MITVTTRAKEELYKLLNAKVDWPGACLRLMDRGGGKLGLGIDIQAPDDMVVDYEGTKLMVVDGGLASTLNDITLDVDSGPEGTELVISEASCSQPV